MELIIFLILLTVGILCIVFGFLKNGYESMLVFLVGISLLFITGMLLNFEGIPNKQGSSLVYDDANRIIGVDNNIFYHTADNDIGVSLISKMLVAGSILLLCVFLYIASR